MLRNTLKKPYIIKGSICAIIVALLLIVFIIYKNITLFTTGDGYINSDGKTYVSTISEFKYQVAGFGSVIGKIDGPSFVFQIKDEDPNNYIVVKGLFNPAVVYRNKNIPAVDFSKLSISEISFTYKSGIFQKEIVTKDSAIIKDLTSAISTSQSSDKVPQSINNYYKLTVYSDELKGIGYLINIKVDKNKNVYIDEIGSKGEAIENILAGKNLSDWVNSINK